MLENYGLIKEKKVKNAKKVKGKKLRHRGSNPGRQIQSPPLYQLSYWGGRKFGPKIEVYIARIQKSQSKNENFTK